MHSIGDILVALLRIIGACLAYIALTFTYRKLKKLPPGPLWRLPFLGDTLSLTDLFYWRKLHAKYGPVVRITLFGETAYAIADPDVILKLLNAEHDLVEGCFPSSMTTLLGKHSLLIATGDEHKRLRKAIAPAFKQGLVSAMIPSMAETISELCIDWAGKGIVSGNLKARDFPLMIFFRDLLGYSASDADVLATNELRASFSKYINNFLSLPFNIPGTGFHKSMTGRAELTAQSHDMIQKLRKTASSGKGDNTALASHLVSFKEDNGKHLEDAELMDTFITLLTVSQLALGSTVSRMFQLLHNEPSVMAKLRAEQREVVAAYGESFTADVLPAMPYAEAVVKETLRIGAPVPFAPRRTLAPLSVLGYNFPKGTLLYLSIPVVTATMDRRWMNATGEMAQERFCPERWLTPEGMKSGPLLGYGSGPRLCLGWRLVNVQLKILVAILARKLTWSLVDPNEPFLHLPVPTAAKGLQMEFKSLVTPPVPGSTMVTMA